MFSVLLPSQLPLTQGEQVDETHLVFALESESAISHIVVFMTGVQPFPVGFSATVHLLWPGSVGAGGEPNWQLLGCLRNTKPSSVFKVKPPSPSSASSTGANSAKLGISIEPDALVDQQMATLTSSTSTFSTTNAAAPSSQSLTTFNPTSTPTSALSTPEQIAESIAPKIAKNAFDYLSSFAPDSAPQTVPLLQKWLQQLQRKLAAQGVAFLDKKDE